MPALFYVVWWASNAAIYALLAVGEGAMAAPFVALSFMCLGAALGWRRAGKRKGGDE